MNFKNSSASNSVTGSLIGSLSFFFEAAILIPSFSVEPSLLLFYLSTEFYLASVHHFLQHLEEFWTLLDRMTRHFTMILTVAFLLIHFLIFFSLSTFQASCLNQGLIHQSHGHANVLDIPFHLQIFTIFHCIHLESPRDLVKDSRLHSE